MTEHFILDLKGDPTDFSGETRVGHARDQNPPIPNDFSSYWIGAHEVDDEWLISGPAKEVMKCRPFVRKHIATLGRVTVGDSVVVVVTLKQGVNTAKIKYLMENCRGSFGRNRKVSM